MPLVFSCEKTRVRAATRLPRSMPHASSVISRAAPPFPPLASMPIILVYQEGHSPPLAVVAMVMQMLVTIAAPPLAGSNMIGHWLQRANHDMRPPLSTSPSRHTIGVAPRFRS